MNTTKNVIDDLINHLGLIISSKFKIDREELQSFLRSELRKFTTDNMTMDILKRMLENYNNNVIFTNNIIKELTWNNKSHRKIRKENFRSEISENIVKFAIFKKYGIMPIWNVHCGDLEITIDKKLRLEVKAFVSNGPSTFGPKEYWDWIYFVDCKDTLNCNFKVYEIKLSSKDDRWECLKVNKLDTIKTQANQGRRPRLTFNQIREQIGDDIELIFDGHLSELE